MFSRSGKTSFSTGERNIEACKKNLEELDIELVGEDTGGNVGRTVDLSTRTGNVTVSKKI